MLIDNMGNAYINLCLPKLYKKSYDASSLLTHSNSYLMII
jgi:hypothetical protein